MVHTCWLTWNWQGQHSWNWIYLILRCAVFKPNVYCVPCATLPSLFREASVSVLATR